MPPLKVPEHDLSRQLNLVCKMNTTSGRKKVPPLGSGVKTEEIGKGRILADLRDILRDFGEILPLQKSNEKPRKT